MAVPPYKSFQVSGLLSQHPAIANVWSAPQAILCLVASSHECPDNVPASQIHSQGFCLSQAHDHTKSLMNGEFHLCKGRKAKAQREKAYRVESDTES